MCDECDCNDVLSGDDDYCVWCAPTDFAVMADQDLRDHAGWPDRKTRKLRIDLVTEEYEELCAAYANLDLGATADAIADLVYVLGGMGAALGIDMHAIYAEVHETNMRKLTGPVRDDGKRLKPDDWEPPQIDRLIDEMGRENQAVWQCGRCGAFNLVGEECDHG